jgi:hypothetical protein
MGPEFPLQRATWRQGLMVTDPPFSEGGEGLAPAPGLQGHEDRPPGTVGEPTFVSDRPWAEGERILNTA